MKKTMKLTYLLTLLVLLFSFTACGNTEEKKEDNEKTTVADNKEKGDEDTKDSEEEKDSEETDSEESSTEETATTEPATGSSYSLGDITYTVSDEWTYSEADSSDIMTAFKLPTAEASKDKFHNNFIVQVTNVGTEISEEELKNSADLFIQAYEESFDATLVSQETTDTPCGVGMAFTLDVTKMLESQGVSGVQAYIKQVIFVKGTNTYFMQLTCATADFDELSKGLDAALASITVK